MTRAEMTWAPSSVAPLKISLRLQRDLWEQEQEQEAAIYPRRERLRSFCVAGAIGLRVWYSAFVIPATSISLSTGL
jgi:hypothetical protein